MSKSTPQPQSLLVHRDHRRTYGDNVYVYPVVSRRSKGVSIGINLNPDKICNFDCVYCQVDRSTPGPVKDVDPAMLCQELEAMLDLVQTGELFAFDHFAQTPMHLRRLNDFAFSGDGEPTTCPQFPEIVRIVADRKRERDLADVKIVLITNATRLHHPKVQQGLQILHQNNGEVWAKLEAGTDEYYQRIERTVVPFRQLLDNVTSVAKKWPIVIQSLFMCLNGEPPTQDELSAFCDRLNEIVSAGGQIKLVQVYTVARRPAEDFVSPLRNDEVDRIVALVEERTGLRAEAFYGPES